MKKFYLKKPALLAALSVALITVSCGLAITELTFSTHTLKQGEELTITTKFERPDDQYQNNENLYVYYAVRVPDDWDTSVMLKAKDDTEYEGQILNSQDIEFENSEFYSKLMELSYPRDGYKWLAYQSTKTYTISGQPATAVLVLTAGNTIGTYELDVIAGSSKSSPVELLTESGEINYDLAFNYTDDNKNYKGDGTKYNVFQEYLANASTLSDDEIESRKFALENIKVNGNPISPADIPNHNSNFNRTVEVTENAGIDDVTGDVAEVNVVAVDGGVEVEAQDAVATVYSVTGTVVDSRAVNGIARLNAQRGLNIVKVQTLAGTSTSKVIVK